MQIPANPVSTPLVARQPSAEKEAPGSQQDIQQTAEDFESLFMSLLLKEMRETLEPGALFGEQGGDVYGGLFDSYLGQHLARGGSLGIAQAVRAQLGGAPSE